MMSVDIKYYNGNGGLSSLEDQEPQTVFLVIHIYANAKLVGIWNLTSIKKKKMGMG